MPQEPLQEQPPKTTVQKMRENLAYLRSKNAPRARIQQEIERWKGELDRESSEEKPYGLQDLDRDVSGVLGHAYQGLTLGLGNKLTAATRTMLPEAMGGTKGFDYSKAVGDERNRLEGFREKHPYIAAGAEAVGSVPALLATGGAGEVAEAPTLLRSMGAGAKFGGAAGIGEQDNPTLDDVIRGGVKGAVAGGVTAGAMHGAARVPSAAMDFTGMRPSRATTNRLGRAAIRGGVTPIEDRALETVMARMKRGGVTSADATSAAAEARDLGKPVTMLEVGGKQVTRLGRGAQGIPSRGADEIQSALETRRRGAPVRVGGDVEQGLGQARADMYEATQALSQQQKAKAAPLYKKAMQAAPLAVDTKVPGQEISLADVLRRPSAQKAIGYEQQLAKEEGRQPFPSFTSPADDPALASMTPEAKARFMESAKAQGVTPPDVSIEQLHNLKLRLDEMIGYAKAGGTLPDGTPATKKMLSAIQETKNHLLSVMDAHEPTYAKARRTWGGDAELQDALELGHDFLNSKRPLGELKHDFSQFSDAGREQARRGVVSAVREKIDAAQDGADVTRRIFGNEAQRQRLRAVFADDASFARFRRQMEIESQMAKNENRILGNSQTAEKLGDVHDLMETTLPQGGNLLSVRGAANAALRRADALRQGVATRAQVDALAPYLTAGADPSHALSLEDVLAMGEQRRGRAAPRARASLSARAAIGGATGRELNRP